jgi:hypothetical protein
MPNSNLTRIPNQKQERYLLQLFQLRRQAQRMKLVRVVRALSALIFRVSTGVN